MPPDFLLRNMAQDERELMLWTEATALELMAARFAGGKESPRSGSARHPASPCTEAARSRLIRFRTKYLSG